MSDSGIIRGKHYTDYIEHIKELKTNNKLDELESLLLEIIDATEEEDKEKKWGVAPSYYDELAKLYRKKKENKKEIDILKRFSKQRHARGKMPAVLLERLEKLTKQ